MTLRVAFFAGDDGLGKGRSCGRIFRGEVIGEKNLTSGGAMVGEVGEGLPRLVNSRQPRCICE